MNCYTHCYWRRNPPPSPPHPLAHMLFIRKSGSIVAMPLFLFSFFSLVLVPKLKWCEYCHHITHHIDIECVFNIVCSGVVQCSMFDTRAEQWKSITKIGIHGWTMNVHCRFLFASQYVARFEKTILNRFLYVRTICTMYTYILISARCCRCHPYIWAHEGDGVWYLLSSAAQQNNKLRQPIFTLHRMVPQCVYCVCNL